MQGNQNLLPELISKIRDHISQGELEKAIEQLQKITKRHDTLSTFSDQVILLSMNYQVKRREELNGVLANSDKNIAFARTGKSLLSLIQKIEKEIKSAKNGISLSSKSATEIKVATSSPFVHSDNGNAARSVFISYSFKDSKIATKFSNELRAAGHKTFLAEDSNSIKIGQRWSNRITEQIFECDYFLIFISKHSINSESVIAEVQLAVNTAQDRKNNMPGILPVRINLSFEHPLPYNLASLLNGYQHATWKTDNDTERISKEILGVLEAKNANQIEPKALQIMADSEQPVSAAALNTPPDPAYYIERKKERRNREYIILDPKALLRVHGPSKYGLNSYLAGVTDHARKNNYLTATLDFSIISGEVLRSSKKLVQHLYNTCCQDLEITCFTEDIESKLNDDSQDLLSNFTSFFEDFVLAKTDKYILLALNQVDRLYEYNPNSADFFIMLRNWHEKSGKGNSKFSRLKIAMTYCTDRIKMLLNEFPLGKSPFNVGRPVELEPFNQAEVKGLIGRYGATLSYLNDSHIQQLTSLIGGHPFLIRKALYLLASGEYDFDQLMTKAANEQGPFGDHLKSVELKLTKSGLTNTMLNVIKLSDEGKINSQLNIEQVDILRGLGLINGERPKVYPRFELYSKYFKKIHAIQ